MSEKNKPPRWWAHYKKSNPLDKDQYDPKRHCCSTFWKDFCSCTKENLISVRNESRLLKSNYNSIFLYRNGIITEPTGLQNVVISYDWHNPRYISLRSFSFRWKGSKNWVSKGKRIRSLDTKLKESKYKGLTVREAIKRAPVYMKEFIDKSHCLFMPECYFLLGFEKNEDVREYEKSRTGFLIPFGKHKGKSIEYIYNIDKQYLLWLYNNWNTAGS